MTTENDDPHDELMSALSTLHLSGRFSDLTIICNDKRWAVHKAIICSRSGFFDGACSNTFRESDTGVIDLSEDDQEGVEQMIYYFYYLDYMTQQTRRTSPVFKHRARLEARRRPQQKLDLAQIEDPLLAQAGLLKQEATSPDAHARISMTSLDKNKRSLTPPPASQDVDESYSTGSEEEDGGSDSDDSNLVLHTRVYALAEKFDIPGLKELAKTKFEIAMACYYDSPRFADAIAEVYSSTVDSDRGLRDVVLQAFRSHPQLANTQDVFNVIKTTPTLAFELFKVERALELVDMLTDLHHKPGAV